MRTKDATTQMFTVTNTTYPFNHNFLLHAKHIGEIWDLTSNEAKKRKTIICVEISIDFSTLEPHINYN